MSSAWLGNHDFPADRQRGDLAASSRGHRAADGTLFLAAAAGSEPRRRCKASPAPGRLHPISKPEVEARSPPPCFVLVFPPVFYTHQIPASSAKGLLGSLRVPTKERQMHRADLPPNYSGFTSVLLHLRPRIELTML